MSAGVSHPKEADGLVPGLLAWNEGSPVRIRRTAMLRARVITALVACATAMAGCSSMPELVVGAIPTAPAAPSLKGATLYDEPPTEMYVRIARGANTCWFGRDGTLKATHILHADLDPPHKGGGAEIIIFERDPNAETGSNPRALRSLRILISRTDARTQVDAQPLRVTLELGIKLVDDVHRWAGGNMSCAGTTPHAPAASAPPPLAPVAVAPAKGTRAPPAPAGK